MKNFTQSCLFILAIMFTTVFVNQVSAQKSAVDDLILGDTNKNLEIVSAPEISNSIVISQIYGGAGCGTSGCSTYKNDYIELYNRGSVAVSVNGWSVQYTSATGTAWQVTNLTNVTLQPGQYYLVAEAAGANGVNNLPAPDASGTTAMSATAAKVALVNTTTALTVSCPTGAQIIDLVGYGATANCSEGSSPAPAPSTTTAGVRKAFGAQDTDVNSADFTAATPSPRNTSTPYFTSANTTTFNTGNAGAFTVTTSGNPAATSVIISGDALPAGITFTDNGNGTGTLSGTAAMGTNGTYNLVFTSNNGVTGTGQNFSLVIAAAPTAASATVGGRVTEANGRGIFRARVTLIDSQGIEQTAYTNTQGYYSFPDVPGGQTYVFTVRHLRYQFAEPSLVEFVDEDNPNINFVSSGENLLRPANRAVNQ